VVQESPITRLSHPQLQLVQNVNSE
jgi:hypothetical protein